jgi:hypothetical protein
MMHESMNIKKKVVVTELLGQSPSLVDLKIYYLAHNSHTLISNLSQVNPV